MAQQIRFCKTVDGVRIAYACTGSGPVIVCPPPWIGHLELGWESPQIRSFFETLSANHTIVRYDRHGTGLSDRHRVEFSLQSELNQLDAVVTALGLERFALFSSSYAGAVGIAYAVQAPERVSHLILYGTQAKWPAELKPEVRDAIIALVRAHWGMASRTIADMTLPDASAETIRWLALFQQKSAEAEMAARMYKFALDLNVTDLLPRIAVPTLVLHRRGDHSIPVDSGRELAAMIPGARFALLDGESHPPYFGDSRSVLEHIFDFLGDRDERIAVSDTDQGTPSSSPKPSQVLNANGSNGTHKSEPADEKSAAGSFRRQGDFWNVSYAGKVCLLKHVKGMQYLEQLLRHPAHEFHALELASLEAADPAERSAPELELLGKSDALQDDAGVQLDSEAKAAYRRRLVEIREDLADAQRCNDPGRVQKANAEIEFLTDELARAVGLGGRDRRAASNTERARIKVSKAIKGAIGRIEENNPDLGRHLNVTIRTGSFCSYNPDPLSPPLWRF